MSWKYNFEAPLDSPERTILHGHIIRQKKFLRKLYEQWYSGFLKELPDLPPGELIELGSGGGFLKELEPRILATDVLNLPSNDMTFSALEMPFSNKSVAAIFMIDTLHHIPDMKKFFEETNRILAKGGKIVMIEPANTIWGRLIFKNFHHEPFEPKAGWELPEKGPLSAANGAMPWIVLHRDRVKFNALFPDLTIKKCKYINPLLYLLSGGLSMQQLLPNFMYGLTAYFDKILPKLNKEIAMFQEIVIQKRV